MTNIVSTTNPPKNSILKELETEQSTAGMPQCDPFETQDPCGWITNKIIADLEKGILTWVKPWKIEVFTRPFSRPMNANGVPYQGINLLSLWERAAKEGYASPFWLTYNEVEELGGQVKKGEKAIPLVSAILETGMGRNQTDKSISVVTDNKVFNVQQIAGLPGIFYQAVKKETGTPKNRFNAVKTFIDGTKAKMRYGFNQIFYLPVRDQIYLPFLQSFPDKESYYGTLCHELVHWTRHEKRLNRNFTAMGFGNDNYAFEELIAEIGSAFLCADLKIIPVRRKDHAKYIHSWLNILKKDSRAIFTAASYTQRAVDYLQSLNSPQTTPNNP